MLLARARRPIVLVLATVAALVLTLPAAAPASAALPKAGAPWVTAQSVTGRSVTLSISWPRVKGATRYEVDLVASRSGKALSGAQITRSSATRTRSFAATKGTTQKARLTRLKPGTVYCVVVRGLRGSRTVGPRSAPHCRMTTERDRAATKGRERLAVATYNVCSGCASGKLPAWGPSRATRVADRIARLTVGTSKRRADVVTIQEGDRALAENEERGDLENALAGTFTRGCKPSDGTSDAYDNNVGVLLRDATLTAVPGTAGGMTFKAFDDDATHGACWVEARSRATGRTYAFVGLHVDERAGADANRKRETAAVHAAVTKALPGRTVIYAGDTNSSRSRKVDGPRVALAGKGYDDAYDVALRYQSHPHQNSAIGTSGTVRTSTLWGDHIDRVLVPRGVTVTAWKVDHRLTSRTRYATPLASDHDPVIVELRLPR